MTVVHLSPPRRAHCPRCVRPVSACVCRWVVPVSTSVDLLILQHPMEVNNAKGSARLLHLSVRGSTMLAGETFDPPQLRAALYGGGRVPVLLYPDTPGQAALGIAAAPALPSGLEAQAIRLVVLDGTWRKSRKMLYLNPLLQALPRLPLRDMGASRYSIRKAHAPDQLSTLEASCHALSQLDGDMDKFGVVSDSFAAFVDHFIAHQGKL